MAEALFYAVLTGGALGLLFDALRFSRLLFNDKFFFDFFFWIISSIVVFCYLLVFNNGSIRAVYLAFILLGFLAVIFSLGYATKPVQQRLAKKIKIRLKKLKKVLQKLYNILYNIKVKSVGLSKRKLKGGKNGKGKKQKE
ncbi:MAG: spore cortex biosynthesis protein YabQ [Eubacterium sp.]